MRNPIVSLSACAFLILSAAAHAGELPLDKLPEPVRSTAVARFPDATVTGAATEKADDGKDIYEISMEDKDKTRIKVTVTPAGVLSLIEVWIARTDLPESITTTLEKKYPKARYVRVKKVLEVVKKEEKLTSYEVVLVTPKKKIWGVDLAPDGKIVSTEKKASENED